jgi:hypothetical protein
MSKINEIFPETLMLIRVRCRGDSRYKCLVLVLSPSSRKERYCLIKRAIYLPSNARDDWVSKKKKIEIKYHQWEIQPGLTWMHQLGI